MSDPSSEKPRILFLCTGNCCRSPLAEALFRHIAGDRYESLSAGVSPAGFVHPLVLQVLDESGVDAEGLASKHILEYVPPGGVPPHLLISLCGYARSECPGLPGDTGRAHWPFPDPYSVQGSAARRLGAFRATRDAILHRLERALEGDEIEGLLRGTG